MAAEALALHIKGMIEDGEPIPEPSTMDQVSNDPAREGAICFLVSVPRNVDKPVRLAQ